MADTTPIPCPECKKVLNVPEKVLGKKIKCKDCDTAFVAEAPKKGVKPSKPGGAAKPKKEEPEPPPKPEAPKPPASRYDDDDESDGKPPKALGTVDEGEDVARCPHCAKELEPPTAIICIHCGFNNVTRTKAESKKVWAPDANDWMSHLAPGLGALAIFIALIVLNIVCIMKMEDWMTDGALDFLKSEEKGLDGKIKFAVKPGAFMTFVLAGTIIPMIKTARFAFKRLAIEYQPTEQVKK
jgi:hypothetical protein